MTNMSYVTIIRLFIAKCLTNICFWGWLEFRYFSNCSNKTSVITKFIELLIDKMVKET